ncbi:MAG: ABC transporter permease [Firmicutes bacterium]|nr:ABC transporter permease [Bacillota bacterium]
MNVLESLRMAWLALVGNKLRSLLTMLGVIIGVAAVITLVAVGQGASAQVSQQIQNLGSNLIMVVPTSRAAKLTIQDSVDLPRRVPTITQVVPSVGVTATVKWQGEGQQVPVEGVSENLPQVRDFHPAAGRFLAADDVKALRHVAVVGQTVVDNVFDSLNPIGKTLLINGQNFNVIGVMDKKGSNMGQDMDNIVFIPVTTAQRLFGTDRVSRLYIQAASPEVASLAVAHITAIYDKKFGRERSVMVSSQDQILATVSTMTQTFTMMLAAIAGISLLVGGIGIMNIMLVSVTERTREIGIRKAIGAKRRDVLGQFLVESIFLSLTGGIIGILTGVGGSQLISRVAGFKTLVSLEAVLLASLFSAAVGVFFGIYPAMKASNLDPIEALRYE